MKSIVNYVIILTLAISLTIITTATGALSLSPLPPLSTEAPDVIAKNKVITKTFVVNQKIILLLDDNSLWGIDPQYSEVSVDNHERLVGYYVTIMPAAENPENPVLFIIDNKKEFFNANLVGIPAEAPVIENVDLEGMTLDFSQDKGYYRLGIHAEDRKALENWKDGQKLVVGGVRFLEFDSTGRSQSEYMYLLFNYDKKEFVHFTFQKEFL